MKFKEKDVYYLVLNVNQAMMFIDEESGIKLNALNGVNYIEVENIEINETIEKAINYGILLPYSAGGKYVGNANVSKQYLDIRYIVPSLEKELGEFKNDSKEKHKKENNKKDNKLVKYDISKIAKEMLKSMKVKEFKMSIKNITDLDLLEKLYEYEYKKGRRKSILIAIQTRIKELQSGKTGEVVTKIVDEIIIK